MMKFFSTISGLAALLCGLMLASRTSAFVPSTSGSIGCKSTSLHMTVLTHKGKKLEFKEGSSLSAACAKLGVKPKFSCKRGDCGSCTVSVGGSRIKACVGKVPPMPKLKSLQEKGLEIK